MGAGGSLKMAASFLAITIIIMFISGLPEKDVVNGFTHGASELVGVALIIGLARAVNIISRARNDFQTLFSII